LHFLMVMKHSILVILGICSLLIFASGAASAQTVAEYSKQQLRTMRLARERFSASRNASEAQSATAVYQNAMVSIARLAPADSALRTEFNNELLMGVSTLGVRGLAVQRSLLTAHSLLQYSFFEFLSGAVRRQIIYHLGDTEFTSREVRQIFPVDFKAQLEQSGAEVWQIKAAFLMFQSLPGARTNFSFPLMMEVKNQFQFDALKATLAYHLPKGSNHVIESSYQGRLRPAIRWANSSTRIELLRALIDNKNRADRLLLPPSAGPARGPEILLQLLADKSGFGARLLNQMTQSQLQVDASMALLRSPVGLQELGLKPSTVGHFLSRLETSAQVASLAHFLETMRNRMSFDKTTTESISRTRQPFGDKLASLVGLPDTSYLYGDRLTISDSTTLSETSRNALMNELYEVVGIDSSQVRGVRCEAMFF
jgi:hypothetical protein